MEDKGHNDVRNRVFEMMDRITGNIVTSRANFFREMTDPRRDIDDACGYPKGTITAHAYQQLYDRLSTAARVVEVLPKESWQVQPVVYEEESAAVITEFEEAWTELPRQIEGEESYYDGDRGTLIWEYLSRIDELSGVGQYGILFLGLDDGLPLSKPANLTGSRKSKLLYLRNFPESLAPIQKFEQNPRNPRFGKPVLYQLKFNDPEEFESASTLPTSTVDVHWTRVIHVADNLWGNEVFGVPRMQTVYNHLLDVKKLYGGSAEMYWAGAFPGLSVETDPGQGGDVDVDTESIRDAIEKYINGLNRYLFFVGAQTKSLSPQVVDPTPQIMVLLQAICIKLGIPMRIFMGSERGEMASSQDDAKWNERLKKRQRDYTTPKVIVPFVNRLISAGVLPKPKRFCVDWPDLTSQSDKEKSAVALQRSQAMAQYVSSGACLLMTPQDFACRILGFTDLEAESFAKNVKVMMKDPYFKRLLEQTKQAKAGLDKNAKANTKPTGQKTKSSSRYPPK